MPKPSHACFPVFAVFAAVDSALSTSAVSSSGFFPHFSIFSNPMIQITDITHRQIAAAPNTALHPISHITTAASRYEASVPTTCEDTILTQNFIFCSRLTISAKIRITGGQIIACAYPLIPQTTAIAPNPPTNPMQRFAPAAIARPTKIIFPG